MENKFGVLSVRGETTGWSDESVASLSALRTKAETMSLLGKKTSELTPEEVEFLKEAAETLRREAEKLEEALENLKRAEAALESVYARSGKVPPAPFPGRQGETGAEQWGADLAEAVSRYTVAWKRAERARYAYIVHREAIGFRRHTFADKLYPLPPFRKIQVGGA